MFSADGARAEYHHSYLRCSGCLFSSAIENKPHSSQVTAHYWPDTRGTSAAMNIRFCDCGGFASDFYLCLIRAIRGKLFLCDVCVTCG